MLSSARFYKVRVFGFILLLTSVGGVFLLMRSFFVCDTIIVRQSLKPAPVGHYAKIVGEDSQYWVQPKDEYAEGIMSDRGVLVFYCAMQRSTEHTGEPMLKFDRFPVDPSIRYGGVLGFSKSHEYLTAPIWVFALLFGALGFLAMKGRKGQKGIQCTRCGYDLRASPHRCPECGSNKKSSK
jgi:hypothetical protein